MKDLYDWPWVESQVQTTITVWNDCSARDALCEPLFSRAEQRTREKAYDQALRAVEREVTRAPRTKAGRLGVQRRDDKAEARKIFRTGRHGAIMADGARKDKSALLQCLLIGRF